MRKNTMFYGEKTQDTRQLFFLSWDKYRQKKNLSALESQIVDVMIAHPEYHGLFEKSKYEKEHGEEANFGDENPFLHMGLHLALRDQIATNRPIGISPIYQALLMKKNDVMWVEHALMARLEACLWKAQEARCMPDEVSYLEACRQLL